MADLVCRPLLVMSLTAQLKPSRMMEVADDDPENTLTEMSVADLETP